MEPLSAFFSVNTVFVTILGYPLSYIELIGTIANIWSVYLVSKKKILSWPVGIIGVILFLSLFYQIRLYSDMLEQVYFLVTSIWGWWLWVRLKQENDTNEIQVTHAPVRDELKLVGVTLVGTIALWQLTVNLPGLLPAIFPEAPSFALLDAFTTVMSFVATYLMIKRRVSCWYYWILVDVIGIGLYYIKDVKLISLLYVVFLILAINGLYSWKKSSTQSNTNSA